MKWVKASERKPDSWENIPMRYIEGKRTFSSDEIWSVQDNHFERRNELGYPLEVQFNEIEWLDESSSSELTELREENKRLRELLERKIKDDVLAEGYRAGMGTETAVRHMNLAWENFKRSNSIK